MIGKKLKELRKTHNIKPQELADRLSVSVQAYYKYEKDTNEPNIENLKKLANLHHITIDELVGNETKLINIEALEKERAEVVKKVLGMTNAQLGRVDSFIKGMLGD